MSRHYAPGDESPFLKRVMVPFWISRIIIMGCNILTYGLVVGLLAWWNSKGGTMEEEENGKVVGTETWAEFSKKYNLKSTINSAIAICAVVMVLILVCLVLDIVCIIKRYRHSLRPRFFLIVNVIQTTFWTIMFVLGFFGARTPWSTVLSVIPYFSFVGLLIYASVIFHKFRRGTLGHGNYAPTFNGGGGAGGQLLAENTGYPLPEGSHGYSQGYPEPSYGARDGDHHEMSYVPAGGKAHGQNY